MKILIAGGYCSFCEFLINRLNREKHEVYIISGIGSNKMTKKCINYDVDLADEKLKYILYSIMPDAVIFIGALDENYDFTNEQKSAMDYTAGLSNLLVAAFSVNILRFIYLSSSVVYGTGYNEELKESMEKKPEDVKGLIISEGEAMCLGFLKMSRMKIDILRISSVYGIPSSKNIDYFNRLFAEAMEAPQNHDELSLPSAEIYLSPVYFSDVVDAVYKVVTIDKDESGIYNVSAGKTELSYIYKKIGELTSIRKSKGKSSRDAESNHEERSNEKGSNEKGSDDESDHEEGELLVQDEVVLSPPVNLCVDHSLITGLYGYKPLVDIDTGIERMYQSITKQSSKKEKAKKEKSKKRIFQIIKPFIENFFVFAVMAAISNFIKSDMTFLNDFNFMVLYIVIIAMTFGLFQASLSIVLAGFFVVWQIISSGTAAFDALINLETMGKILELMIIGIICGHAKDQMSTSIYEKNLELLNNQNELETIYKINDANIKIKQTLDERLTNYEDSLAKIYSIVDKLNSLQPDAVFFSAINVIMEIMKADDVSIYIVTGGSFKMCRLMAKTPSSVRFQKKSVALSDLGELGEYLEKNEIYVNRNLDENMPVMAAPIFSQQELVSIIMLWSLKFENINIYNTNRFLVLSQLISSAIERAFIYMQNMNDSMCVPGTSILKAEAFENILDVHKEAARHNTSTYEIIYISNIDPQTGTKLESKEVSLKLRPLLRSTDYIGQCRDDMNKLLVLLTNTNTDDSKFVYDRITNAGLSCSRNDAENQHADIQYEADTQHESDIHQDTAANHEADTQHEGDMRQDADNKHEADTQHNTGIKHEADAEHDIQITKNTSSNDKKHKKSVLRGLYD